jgi:hypothetical protein
MEAYIRNTETGKIYKIQYLEAEIDGGGYTANYQSPSVPFAVNSQQFWLNSQPNPRSLTIHIDGQRAVDDVILLKSFCVPESTKSTPSILQFKIANLPTVNVVFTNVSATFNLLAEKPRSQQGILTRARVVIQYLEV